MNKKTDEKKKGDDGGGKKNSGGGGSKRGEKNRGVIDGSVLKEKEGNDYNVADLWDEHDFDVVGKEGTEWGNNERDEGNSKTNQGVVQI